MKHTIFFKSASRLGIAALVIFSGPAFFTGRLTVRYLISGSPGNAFFLFLPCLLCCILSLNGLHLFLANKKLTITPEEISLEGRLKTRSITWDEVEYVEQNSGNMIIGNRQKRLAFPSPEYWSEPGRQEALSYLTSRMLEKGLELESSARALWPFSRGF